MIFPGYELISAIEDQDDEPNDKRRILHIKALARELLMNIEKEINRNENCN